MLNDPACYWLARDLIFSLTSPGQVHLQVHSQALTLDSEVLSVIQAFREPATMLEASHHFERICQSGEQFGRLLEMSRRLAREGFLLKDCAPQPLTSDARGFGSSAEHARMLNDTSRTRLLVEAVESVVKPGDVVLDIGSGTGILAMAAARAGARRVFALEQGSMATVAESLVQANGFADIIEIIRAWSWEVELPELADVVIGEILGNDPLGEGILVAYQDAARRLAKPEARFVPGEIRLSVHPVNVPSSILRDWSFVPDALSDWQHNYGFDFSTLVSCLPDTGEYRLASPETISQIHFVGPGQALAAFHPQSPLAVTQAAATLPIHKGESMNGVLLGWEAHLTEDIVIKTRPPLIQDCSWQLLVWLLPSGQEIQGPAMAEVDWSFSGKSSFRVNLAS